MKGNRADVHSPINLRINYCYVDIIQREAPGQLTRLKKTKYAPQLLGQAEALKLGAAGI
jgi:hypothetical protein